MGVGVPAETLVGLHERHPVGAGEPVGGGEPGHTGTDDDHARPPIRIVHVVHVLPDPKTSSVDETYPTTKAKKNPTT